MEKYQVKPDKNFSLAAFDPNDTSAVNDKKSAAEALTALNARLEVLQETLYAEHRHKVLIILQGMDTSGKDGVIRHVFDGVNPQGVRVASFKAPTTLELDHDYLWRIHQHMPAKGEMVIFNRSHYEDVLITRVHQMITEKTCQRRYQHINAFEKMLHEEGTIILKFFLHIDAHEQAKRLLKRVETPAKNWKFNPADLAERKHWQAYQQAYTDALAATSTDWAGWHVIPANKKWYRNFVIASILVETLENLKMRLPESSIDLTPHQTKLRQMLEGQ